MAGGVAGATRKGLGGTIVSIIVGIVFFLAAYLAYGRAIA